MYQVNPSVKSRFRAPQAEFNRNCILNTEPCGVSTLGDLGRAEPIPGRNSQHRHPVVYAITGEFSENHLVTIKDTGPGSDFSIVQNAGYGTAFHGISFTPAIPL